MPFWFISFCFKLHIVIICNCSSKIRISFLSCQLHATHLSLSLAMSSFNAIKVSSNDWYQITFLLLRPKFAFYSILWPINTAFEASPPSSMLSVTIKHSLRSSDRSHQPHVTETKYGVPGDRGANRYSGTPRWFFYLRLWFSQKSRKFWWKVNRRKLVKRLWIAFG